MALIPLVSSRGLMRELLSSRILPEQVIDEDERAALAARGLLAQLTNWELEGLRMVDSEQLNAPSVGRNRHVTVTKAALADEDNLPGALAHEVGHHRLHHLHPLALSYIYLWPYLYFDERVSRRVNKPGKTTIRKAAGATGRAIFSLLALPGWLAWVVLRLGWRTAEYDADRFACVSGNGETLAIALQNHEKRRQEIRPRSWQDLVSKGRQRLAQGRGLGYLPVPNEHPTPKRRLKQVESWLWTLAPVGGAPAKSANAAASESPS
jgi:Zn-dependent protease with chaperone function